jgi:hypothetical protein
VNVIKCPGGWLPDQNESCVGTYGSSRTEDGNSPFTLSEACTTVTPPGFGGRSWVSVYMRATV